ncbi:MAG: TolC family protein [Planctomycetes bacterium]|nr:TolC family protein [Planctomycetota bacterium]
MTQTEAHDPGTASDTIARPTTPMVVTLETAITNALAASPRLRSVKASLAASKGERDQASAWANPEASVEAENIGGEGQYRGLRSAEVTYGVSQLIEIGGKRSARIDVAEQGATLAGFDYETARLDLVREVQLAYIDAIAAQEQAQITSEQQELAKDVLSVVSQRVGAAREPLIQKSKAEVALSTSTIAHDKAELALVTAKRALASLWGGTNEAYELDNAAFFTITQPAPLAVAMDEWKKNPDFARFDAEVARSKAALDLEKANAVPDPRISAGVRDFRESNDRAFVVGLSLPIPVFNLNRGNIETARQEVTRTESIRENAALTLNTELTRAQAELEIAYNQAVTLKDTILPAAQKAFTLSRRGYGEGKFSYLEVLDAQRTLYETRSSYQDALRDYHRNRAEVERLTATHTTPASYNEEPHE